MHCEQARDHIQEWLDGSLEEGREAALMTHLGACQSCRDEHRAMRALKDELQRLPAPVLPVGLERRLFRAPSPVVPRFTAVAAILVMAVALTLTSQWMPSGERVAAPSPVAQVQLSVEREQKVQVALSAKRELKGVRLTLVLPNNVELAGFPEQREVSWETDLLAGDNRLSLPLIAHSAGSGDLIARIDHNGESREMRVRLVAQVPVTQGWLGPNDVRFTAQTIVM